MSDAPTPSIAPGASQQHNPSSNGQQRKRGVQKKRVRGKGITKPAPRVAAPTIPGAGAGAGAYPQPLPAHRLPRTITHPIAQGVAALTSSFVALCADFTQQLLASEAQPSEKDCDKWTKMFQACIATALPSGPKAA